MLKIRKRTTILTLNSIADLLQNILDLDGNFPGWHQHQGLWRINVGSVHFQDYRCKD